MVSTTLHSALTGSNVHEPKGADSATSGEVITSDGGGATTFKSPSKAGQLNALGNTTGTMTINTSLGDVHSATLTGNVTSSTFSNPGTVTSFILILTQDGTGSRTVTWPASVDWAGGTAPTLSTGAADVDILTFLTKDSGTTWYGFTGGLDFT